MLDESVRVDIMHKQPTKRKATQTSDIHPLPQMNTDKKVHLKECSSRNMETLVSGESCPVCSMVVRKASYSSTGRHPMFGSSKSRNHSLQKDRYRYELCNQI